MAVQRRGSKQKNKRGRSKKARLFTRSNRSKLLVAFLGITVLMGLLITRLTYINVNSGEKYAKKVLSQLDYDSQIIPFKRGDITDRNGTVIATSEKVYNLVIDPYVILNSRGDCVNPTLNALNTYFGLETEDVRKILDDHPDSRYVVMAKQLPYDTVSPYLSYMDSEEEDDVKTNIYVKGIWFEEEYKRTYPYSALACDLIGFTSRGDVGTWGLEAEYDDSLNGTNGREYGYLNTDADYERTTIPAVNGNNIVSTIDVNVQRILEKHIEDFNLSIGSANTAVVAMNPNNGEILGMASYPKFDLNNPRDLSAFYSQEEIDAMTDDEKLNIYNNLWRNFCISDTYEPGSTVKPLTIAAALEEGVVSYDDTFICNGYETFKDGNSLKTIKCNGTHGQVSLSRAIEISCNSALMQIGAKIGVSNFVKYQKLFGFGQKTGIDLPGEASAATMLYNEDTMHTVELATNAFGQTFNLTMVQLAAAFSSIVNGGYYYEPHVVKEIRTEGGSTVEVMDKKLVKNTVSQQTCDWLKQSLYLTVEEGLATDAKIDGYTIGGKTGTAEKLPRGTGKCLVSFISFAPVDDPQIVLYVIIDEPKLDNQGDSTLTTKLTRKIMLELLPYLQIFPSSEVDPEDDIFKETEQETDETGESKAQETSDSTKQETGESESGETGETSTRDKELEDLYNEYVDDNEAAQGQDNIFN